MNKNISDIKKKKIAIIGSGFVGKAAGKGFLGKGNEVVFYDVDTDVINRLRESGYQSDYITNLPKQNDFDFIKISVPTPTVKNEVLLDYLKHALRDIGAYLRYAKKYTICVVRSTVPPGTTEDLVIKTLEEISGKKYKVDFGVSMNPEFLREATADEDFAKPWITVIGSNDEKTASLLNELYQPFRSPIVNMSITEAEMTKYAHNLLNATKISFFNEMRMVNEKMGIDPDLEFKTVVKSAEAIWNPEYGTKNFGPFGGSCLPKDTSGFFTLIKKKFKFEMPVLKGTIETNEMLKKAAQQKIEGKKYDRALGLLKPKKYLKSVK